MSNTKAETSGLESSHDASIPIEHRRYRRTISNVTSPLQYKTWVRHGMKVQVLDISETGATILCPPGFELPIGKECSFVLPIHKANVDKKFRLKGIVYRRYSSGRYAVRFETLLTEQIEAGKSQIGKVITVAAACLLALGIVFLKARNVISFWYGPIIQAYSIGAALYVLSRVIISSFYRPPKDKGHLPTVSLIIAVKNEEAHIAKTVNHCLDSRYPQDRLEVIVVDDGSTDRTWDVVSKLQKESTRFRCFRFPENRGKRHAMAAGSRVANGDILIFIDSDTFLEQEAIYRIVQPFAEPKVGAVAGHTLVVVEKHNIISKMEAVRYFVSQRIVKASESIFNSVTCCPGPLSAYRKSAVLAVLDQWEHQMFMGTKATFGDDRSLTNFILRNYRVLYHSGARCATHVPDSMKVFIKQQLRWKKSWIREFTIAAKFMWKKHPVAAISYFLGVIITLASPLVAFGALFGLPILGIKFNLFGYVLGLLMVYALLGLMYRYYTRSRYWHYGMLFAVLYLVIFSFQNYYALLTVRKNQWGTR